MTGEKYAVDNESAGKVATDTETAIGDIDAVVTSITGPLSDAEGALPPEFSNALARLKTLRENHERDVTRVKTYATSCVGAVRAALAVYENSSAEMVAEQKATEAKVFFEHGTAFTTSETALNSWANGTDTTGAGNNRGLAAVNEGLPSSTEGTTRDHTYERTSTNGGQTVTSETSHSSTGKGFSSSETTHRASNTHNGVTDTTSYYNSTSTRGNEQTQSTSQSYAVSSAGQERSRYATSSTTRTPVAP